MKSKRKCGKSKQLSLYYEFYEGSAARVSITIFVDGEIGNPFFVLSTKEERNKYKRRYYKTHKIEYRKLLEKYQKTEKGKK